MVVTSGSTPTHTVSLHLVTKAPSAPPTPLTESDLVSPIQHTRLMSPQQPPGPSQRNHEGRASAAWQAGRPRPSPGKQGAVSYATRFFRSGKGSRWLGQLVSSKWWA